MLANFSVPYLEHKVLVLQKQKDKRHSAEHSVLRLLKVQRSGVVVNVNGNLVNPGQGMKDNHIVPCICKLFFIEHKHILLREVILLAFEALALNTSHIQHIEVFNRVGKAV